MRVRKAVLPVAGMGTRVLPATKAIPKEMLPVVDRPAIQYVVDEACPVVVLLHSPHVRCTRMRGLAVRLKHCQVRIQGKQKMLVHGVSGQPPAAHRAERDNKDVNGLHSGGTLAFDTGVAFLMPPH